MISDRSSHVSFRLPFLSAEGAPEYKRSEAAQKEMDRIVAKKQRLKNVFESVFSRPALEDLADLLRPECADFLQDYLGMGNPEWFMKPSTLANRVFPGTRILNYWYGDEDGK